MLESFRPGVADRLGVGYADASRVNERIIYCSTSGYGKTGPASSWAGHDLDYLAIGGFLHMSGRRADGGPALPGRHHRRRRGGRHARRDRDPGRAAAARAHAGAANSSTSRSPRACSR